MNFRKKCDFMIQTVDFLILDLIQNKLRCKFLDSLMIKCSSLGDGGIIWIAISFLLICYKNTDKQVFSYLSVLLWAC